MLYWVSTLKEIIRDILIKYKLPTDKDFLYRIARVESDGGIHLKQLGGGPGRGYFQYEPWVAKDVIKRLKLPIRYDKEKLTYDIEYQVIIARRHLMTFREAIPDGDDLVGQACYWKQYWNTLRGRGTLSDFINKNRKGWKT